MNILFFPRTIVPLIPPGSWATYFSDFTSFSLSDPFRLDFYFLRNHGGLAVFEAKFMFFRTSLQARILQTPCGLVIMRSLPPSLAKNKAFARYWSWRTNCKVSKIPTTTSRRSSRRSCLSSSWAGPTRSIPSASQSRLCSIVGRTALFSNHPPTNTLINHLALQVMFVSIDVFFPGCRFITDSCGIRLQFQTFFSPQWAQRAEGACLLWKTITQSSFYFYLLKNNEKW